MVGTLDPEKVKGKILACLRGKNVRVDKGQQVALVGCTYPFFKPTLERASINYLSFIKYLQDQPIEPAQPTKSIPCDPTSHLGLLWDISTLFKGPKKTHVKPCNPNTLIL